MFTNYKNVNLSLNNHSFIVDDLQLDNSVQFLPQYSIGDAVSESEIPNQMWNASLKIQYFLSGADYLKGYIYSNNSEPISGNLNGITFTQGYLSDYSINIEPNIPIKVSASISIFDKITGNFTNSPAITQTGLIFRSSDIQINNLQGYTENLLNNFSRANFNYSCNLQPSYNYYDTGNAPTRASIVFIGERSISSEIVSDNTNLTLPLSGEKFGAIFTFSNPYNTGLYETFGCSGLISSKSLALNTNNPHSHTIKIVQHHVNKEGYIFSVTTGVNTITINSNSGSFPFLSKDGSLSYVDSVYIGDTQLTGFSINRTSSYDQIVSPIPFNVIDDILTVNTSYGNFIWPNKVRFNYPLIAISSLSSNTGDAGSIIHISGTNFVRISDVTFGGGVNAQFQVNDPQTIVATVPGDGRSGPIRVRSYYRNTTGKTVDFYYPPTILSISPVQGVWKDFIDITGYNLSGITGVYFNDTPAFTYTIDGNNDILAQSPETGLPFPSGYIKVYGTGGYGQSYSTYNPIIPIYSFSPESGIPNTPITIYTKIDTGYYSPYSGGFKVRIDGDDCVFLVSGGNSTGALTGLSPQFPDAQSDFIYIYKPDGISTDASLTKYKTYGYPRIDSVSPNKVNQYQYIPVILRGENLRYFFSSSTYVSISGGISGDFQIYDTGQFASALDGSQLVINNMRVTGQTGYYDVFVQNSVSGYNLRTGLFIGGAVNQAPKLSATFNNNGSQKSPSYTSSMSIDSSTGTFAAVRANNTYDFIQYISYVPFGTTTLNVDLIKVNQTTAVVPNKYIYSSTSYFRMNSGIVVGFTGVHKVAFSGYYSDLGTNGAIIYPGANGITGLNEIRIIASRSLGDHSYFLPVVELEVY